MWIRRFLLLTVALTTGCTFTQEGVYIGKGDPFGADAIVKQNKDANLGDGEAFGDRLPAAVHKDLIMVGKASAFRAFDPDEIDEFYDGYAEFAEEVNPGQAPTVDRAQFKEQFAGWTRLKYHGISMLSAWYEDALVPVELSESIRFQNSLGTIMFQATDDLVAARTNEDGFFVIRYLLCRVGEGYSKCARHYEHGIFDGRTGDELSFDLLPAGNGRRIDTVDFRRLPERWGG